MSRTRLFLTVAFGVALILPLMIALAGLSGIGHRWVDILAQFVGPALAATVLLTLAVAIFRLWIAAGLGGGVALILLIAGWPQWVPPRGTPEPESPEFTLYSANVWALNTDIVALARSIEAADADMVLLVEVGDVQVAAVDRIIGSYKYRMIGERVEGPKAASRYVIASRLPFQPVSVETRQLDATGVIATTVLGPITLVGVHLTRPWPFQYQWGQIIQAQGIRTWRESLPGPMIVAGDFNSVSSARIGRQIQKDTGLIPAPGWPGTWHTRLPEEAAVTIDQIYRSPDLALTDRRLGLRNGSDHRPLVTRFRRAASPAS